MRRWLFALTLLVPLVARANGRVPGANDLALNPQVTDRLVARATFGVVQSRDQGAHWSWICEQAIDISGTVVDPPLGLLRDGSLLLLPPTGSALVSRDQGCSWQRAGQPLAERRGVDLTLDPNDPGRLLLITSLLSSLDPLGYGRYETLVFETRDEGRSFQQLAALPDDFEAETLEVAPGDAQRIYVSGSDARDPRLGVLLRSEDGGQSWSRHTVPLPANTGSLFISAIHPADPDTLWVRIAGRGDTIGLLAAELHVSHDKGQTFQRIAGTRRAMFGFALSPDGSQVAYGGPDDGLYVGPADGSGAFQKRAGFAVRCLRWPAEDALYVCGTEPNDPFSVGISRDRGQTFQPLYNLEDTCPAECAEGSTFAVSCPAAWSGTRNFIAASAAMCSVPWARPETENDAGEPEPLGPDAGVAEMDAGELPRADADAPEPDGALGSPQAESRGDGCACDMSGGAASPGGLLLLLAALAFARRRR